MTVAEFIEVLKKVPGDYQMKDYEYDIDCEGELTSWERNMRGVCVYDNDKEVYPTWIKADNISLPSDGRFIGMGVVEK